MQVAEGRAQNEPASIAFLFLGETLLIPHLWPIAEALAAEAPDCAIDLWAATSAHEALLAQFVGERSSNGLRVRQAPGFRHVGDDFAVGRNPPLPPKLPMLARLASRLRGTNVAVCAEQTSLWLPTLLPMRTRFVKTSHGVGSMSARDDRRRRSAALTLVPSERERRTYLDRGMDPDRIRATGYVKSGFRHRTHTRPFFANDRPVLLYAPHWQRHRSSWWQWGRALVEQLARQDSWNVILAPHQRLAERASNLRAVLESVAALPHVHVDLDSFAMVDGSYTAAADLYLGDTSSQFVEFAARPRPAVFLNPDGVDWRADPSYAMWACGTVIDRLDGVLPAIAEAPKLADRYRNIQGAYAQDSLGDVSGAAPAVAAAAIVDLLQVSR